MRLAGSVFTKVRGRSPHEREIDWLERGITWTPSGWARTFLETAPHHRFGYANAVLGEEVQELKWEFEEEPRILCRLRIRSAHVWAKGERFERAWLNAEHLGTSAGITNRELMLSERDPQRAGDLDMFFYLMLPQEE